MLPISTVDAQMCLTQQEAPTWSSVSRNMVSRFFPDLAAVLLQSDVGEHYSSRKPKQILD
jgi:hypothetical protein